MRREENKHLTNFTTQNVSGVTLRISIFEELTLNEYKIAKAENCHRNHPVCKSGCREMVLAASNILEEKYISLPVLW